LQTKPPLRGALTTSLTTARWHTATTYAHNWPVSWTDSLYLDVVQISQAGIIIWTSEKHSLLVSLCRCDTTSLLWLVDVARSLIYSKVPCIRAPIEAYRSNAMFKIRHFSLYWKRKRLRVQPLSQPRLTPLMSF